MIQIPQKGEPLRADWAAQITGRVNSLAPIGSPRMLVRDGIGGFGSEPCPPNHRDRRGIASRTSPPGCFELVERTVTRNNISLIEHFFVNQYYMVGDLLKKCSVIDGEVESEQFVISLESILLSSIGENVQSGEITSWVMLQIDARGDAYPRGNGETEENDEASPQIKIFMDFNEVEECQRDLDFHTIPLFIVQFQYVAEEEVIKGLEITCDFRRGLFGQQVELI